MTTRTGLAILLAWIVLQRLAELAWSARNVARLRARGAVEHGRGHFPAIAALHAAFPLALAYEVLSGGARPGPWSPLWIAVYAAAQALRLWTIVTLREHWTVGIWVVPGMRRVAAGPYRWLRHPNYVAVALELVAAPMLLGAWRTALGATLVNALVLSIRIREEERALGRAAMPVPQGEVMPTGPGASS